MADTTQTALAVFDRALNAFTELVHAVPKDGWSAPTPCDDWDTRALVNHVTVEHLWAKPMLAGQTIAEVGDQFDGDVLGAQPDIIWDGAASASRSAFHGPDALSATVHSSMGDEPAMQYLDEMTFDLLVHGWDLGQAIGRPTPWDDSSVDLLQRMAQHFAPMAADLVAAGVMGPALKVGDDADAQTRLLAGFGRSPG